MRALQARALQAVGVGVANLRYLENYGSVSHLAVETLRTRLRDPIRLPKPIAL